MSASFFIMSKEKRGFATLFVRLQNTKQKINHRFATRIQVDIQAWNNSLKGGTQLKNYKDSNKDLWKKLDEIRDALQATETRRKPCTKEEAKTIVSNIINREEIEAQRKKEEEEAARLAAEQKMTLNKFIDQFLKEIANGSRKTARGTTYAEGTIKAARTALKQFKAFQTAQKRKFDFDDINMSFYYDFVAYLAKRNYNINSTGKIVKQLKAVMAAAEAEGYHHNSIYKNDKFKGTRIDVDSIYLTKEELDAMMNADLSALEPAAVLARDIFMIGVWTAQRISDYNNIKKEDIQKVTKRWIEDVDDPEHPGETMPVIKTKEITYINIRQQKTGAKVAIPCREELRTILEKYDYNIPHLEDQTINRLIKLVAKAAGITEPVTIETSKGGVKREEVKEKCELVMSHTARRTGATLMYLAGIDAYDIIKITGHKDLDMLRKYIKADQLDVVQKLTDKYDYFD